LKAMEKRRLNLLEHPASGALLEALVTAGSTADHTPPPTTPPPFLDCPHP
jgi:hypothetical protein